MIEAHSDFYLYSSCIFFFVACRNIVYEFALKKTHLPCLNVDMLELHKIMHMQTCFSQIISLTQGERRLRELETMVGYSANNKQSMESNDALSYDDDSWINIQDVEDPRGRVGVQWPWEKDEEKSK
mmetsp:Transcript_28559/g.60886  ORF Transcript_28559/g.60886 Transcript_28559/m.60886 type:complete len:126 (-) Transcript_28559:66-443(-)